MFDPDTWFSHPSQPLVMAGPCSVESEEQLFATAKGLSQVPQVGLLRGGVWKPRTRPDAFEGTGEAGLAWLKEAGRVTGLPVATEVATPAHVELALRYGIDVLWIGARTVVNPFSVQQLAEVLQGVDVPVFVKNPVSPDVKLWVGAFERLSKAGLKRLAGIHRGFHYYKESPYRNFPMWEIPIELKRLLDVPVLTDISHICGRRDLLQRVAQLSADLAFDGLMVECHANPDAALTDAQQQITPSALADLLNALLPRSKQSLGTPQVLSALRGEIDDVDDALLQLLARRMEIATRIGAYKRQEGMAVVQMDRWKAILSEHIALGKELGLDPDLVQAVFEAIHQASIRRQSDLFDEA